MASELNKPLDQVHFQCFQGISKQFIVLRARLGMFYEPDLACLVTICTILKVIKTYVSNKQTIYIIAVYEVYENNAKS